MLQNLLCRASGKRSLSALAAPSCQLKQKAAWLLIASDPGLVH